MPISINNNDEQHVRRISWYQIVAWLNECICQADTIRKVPITEIILQYKTTIEKFYKEENDMVENEIIKLLTENAENLKSAEEISKNLDKAKNKLWEKFSTELKVKLSELSSGETCYKDDYKIVYTANCNPIGQNIAEYKTIINEKDKIIMSKVKYANGIFNDKDEYISQNDEKDPIGFYNLIDNFEGHVEDCLNFLVR